VSVSQVVVLGPDGPKAFNPTSLTTLTLNLNPGALRLIVAFALANFFYLLFVFKLESGDMHKCWMSYDGRIRCSKYVQTSMCIGVESI